MEPQNEIKVQPKEAVMIEHDPDQDLYVQAFTSNLFRERVNKGLGILLRGLTESSIVVVANTDETKIVYPPVIRGVAAWSKVDETEYLGLGSVVPTPILPSGTIPPSEAKIIGVFHFHPSGEGFSNGDLQEHQRVLRQGDVSPAGNKIYRHDANYRFGVFVPRFRTEYAGGRGKPKRVLDKLGVLTLQGEPQSFEYEREGFPNLIPQRQEPLLQESGFRTVLADVPFDARHNVDLNPLRLALYSKTQ